MWSRSRSTSKYSCNSIGFWFWWLFKSGRSAIPEKPSDFYFIARRSETATTLSVRHRARHFVWRFAVLRIGAVFLRSVSHVIPAGCCFTRLPRENQ